MKIHFENLHFQEEATNATLSLFEGMEKNPSGFSFALSGEKGSLFQNELGFGNALPLSEDSLFENLQKVQDRFSLEATTKEQFETDGLRFTIEMETGTGKTYVYLNTILSLHKTYGWSKFIIIVPSIAIKEGVMKTLEMTADHFREKFGIPLVKGSTYSLYQGTSPSSLRNFASTNQLQILVMNIQAFNKDNAIIRRDDIDNLNGHRPIDFIRSAKPILIIDEPQSVDNTDLAKKAIAELDPLFQMRYSATPRTRYNPVFRLGPVEAFQKKLVKRIQIRALEVTGTENAPYIRLESTEGKPGAGFSATITANASAKGKISEKRIKVKKDDNLSVKTGNSHYEGYVVDTISIEPGNEYLRFTNGTTLFLGKAIGSLDSVVQDERIKETIKAHLEKELQLKRLGVEAKVLSLFFLDRVSNYREYNPDGTTNMGKYGKVFEAAYLELIQKPEFSELQLPSVEQVHNGYFSGDKRKKGKEEIIEWKDTKGDGAKDDDTYALIMRDKERLLDPAEPLRFIFSHSALREGWDNPNVFQICTLLDAKSEFTKRQQIGRGMRLPVDTKGNRIQIDAINQLSVIVHESYAKFVDDLQKEYKEESGIEFGKIQAHQFIELISGFVRETTSPKEKRKVAEDLFSILKKMGYLNEKGNFTTLLENAFLRPGDFVLEGDFVGREEVILEWLRGLNIQTFVQTKREPNKIKKNDALWKHPEFWKLWDIIKQKTIYRFQFDSDSIRKEAVRRIREIKCDPMKVITSFAQGTVAQGGISAKEIRDRETRDVVSPFPLPDPLEYLQKETDLTRETLKTILKESDSLGEFIKNPQDYLERSAQHIKEVIREIGIRNGLEYIPLPDTYWEQYSIFKDQDETLSEIVSTTNHGLYLSMPTDSDTEKRYAQEQDNKESTVQVFTKLPKEFKVPTPVGYYNPDWAIVVKEETGGTEKFLYFVKETKGYASIDDIRTEEEKQKINSAKKHFEVVFDSYKKRKSTETKATPEQEKKQPHFEFKVVLGTGKADNPFKE
ncbi:restriction endonuclease subunit R [Leptospira levettii]|uniref:restriction endonuclease n=1 Tax=Leptospira levettii TaxID=2023178 RepID=UPI0010932A26|nr:DEAD/DEAH box helicase family protein [Leptospira levettii]TGM75785.1 restriction endonuclease subunit R [Leptospira levettii]